MHSSEETENELITINFFVEEVDLDVPLPEDKMTAWIKEIINLEGMQLSSLNIVFCSDSYLHRLNLEYLHHDTLTDIITFPYNHPPLIEGDLFISIDRVKENARAFQLQFFHELARVIIHGVLHLCGYSDSTGEKRTQMREKEDWALRKFDLL